jgi:CubicO group peptidase (beta-lactamase class C family)
MKKQFERMGIIFTILLSVCFIGFPMTLIGRDDAMSQIKKIFDACDKPGIAGGFAVAALKDGKTVFKGGYGQANSEAKISFTTATVSDYASIAKQFVGLAMAMLIDEKKISLADDIRTYLPEVPDFNTKITIEHLLYHTSGIRDWVGLAMISGRGEEDVITDDFLMRLVAHQKELNFKPGDQFQYSNTGYFLLARIVSRVTNTSFREWMQENIFRPLEMNHTHFSDNYKDIIINRAVSYRKIDDRYGNCPSNLEGCGSSSLFSTMDDMIKWVQNFAKKKVGNENVWQMVFKKGKLNDGKEINYGFGFSIGKDGDLTYYEHGGSWCGFLSQVRYYPQRNVSFILGCNRNPSGVLADRNVFNILLDRKPEEKPQQAETAAKRTEINLDKRLLENYAGYYRIVGWPNFKNQCIKVQEENNGLGVVMPWGEQYKIYPESENVFFHRNVDIQFSFLRDAAGKVIHLVYCWKGNDNQPFPKLETAVDAYEDIGDFYGQYYCPELQTLYTVKSRDGRLVVEHLQNENVQLVQVDRDTYIGDKWWFATVNPVRNAEMRVVGFKVNADSNNIQNLLFVKKNMDPEKK